jgi:hypothetical protein
MARRYGSLPSEIRDLEIDDFEFNLLVASTGTQDEVKQNEKLTKELGHGKKR